MTLHDNDCEGSTEDCCCAYRKEISTLTRSKEDAWKNNHILEAARQEEMKKRDTAEAALTMLKNDVEELRESLNEELFLRMDALTKLAISQAREAKLREALRNCYGVTGSLNVPFIEEALALSTDDTALQQRLAEERERCAKVCEEANNIGTDRLLCAAAIRSMK